MECSTCSLKWDDSKVTISFCDRHVPENKVSLQATYYYNAILSVAVAPFYKVFDMQYDRESNSYSCDLNDWIKISGLDGYQIYFTCKRGTEDFNKKNWSKPMPCSMRKILTEEQKAIKTKTTEYLKSGEIKLYNDILQTLREAKSHEEATENLQLIKEGERIYHLTRKVMTSTDEKAIGYGLVGFAGFGLYAKSLSTACVGGICTTIAMAYAIGDSPEDKNIPKLSQRLRRIWGLKSEAEQVIDRKKIEAEEIEKPSVGLRRRTTDT